MIIYEFLAAFVLLLHCQKIGISLVHELLHAFILVIQMVLKVTNFSILIHTPSLFPVMLCFMNQSFFFQNISLQINILISLIKMFFLYLYQIHLFLHSLILEMTLLTLTFSLIVLKLRHTTLLLKHLLILLRFYQIVVLIQIVLCHKLDLNGKQKPMLI